MKKIKLLKMDPERIANEIGNFITSEISSINFTGGAIGLSGGVDSTVVAALTKRAFDKHNLNHKNKLELVGYLMPSDINRPEDLEDGKKVAEKLNIRYEVINIEPLVKSYGKIDSKTLDSSYHRGNLMSEIRALVLHRKSALEKKLVLGTGNHDEDFGAGYYTLFGDGAVHLSPISGLSKRLVRQMALFLGFEDLAWRKSTAGLEIGQTDFRDLGYTYSFVELISEGKKQGFSEDELRNHFQVKELFENEKKEYFKEYGFYKFNSLNLALDDLFFRNNLSESKARIISPPTLKLNLEYENE